MTGEIALGNLLRRGPVLAELRDLPPAAVAADAEVMDPIERQSLFGRGIGCVDAHLLAAVLLTAQAQL